jgi:hypothetical protein
MMNRLNSDDRDYFKRASLLQKGISCALYETYTRDSSIFAQRFETYELPEELAERMVEASPEIHGKTRVFKGAGRAVMGALLGGYIGSRIGTVINHETVAALTFGAVGVGALVIPDAIYDRESVWQFTGDVFGFISAANPELGSYDEVYGRTTFEDAAGKITNQVMSYYAQ